MLKQMSDSFTELFGGLEDISAEDVVAGFKEGFDTLVNGLKWIVDNKDGIVTAIEAALGIFATLEVSKGVLTIINLINGLKGLSGGGGTDTATTPDGGSSRPFNPTNPITGHEIDLAAAVGLQTFIPLQIDYTLDKFIKDGKELGSGGMDEIVKDMGLDPLEIKAKIWVPDNEAEIISEQIGTVPIYVSFRGGAGGSKFAVNQVHANGLPFVPYDGYLGILHQGERVLTASENRNYTYNSNNYFGNVNLNNGQDIEALTDAIDRKNRRQRTGYGS